MTADFDGRPIVGGRRVTGHGEAEIMDPFRNVSVALVGYADGEMAKCAVKEAREAQPAVAAMPVHARADLIRAVEAIVAERGDLIAETVTRQTGKALKDTRREVQRSRNTLRAAAMAVESETGELVAADALTGGEGLIAMVTREPLGVVAAISPFNAPFNLTMHKAASAIAAGNAVVIKPSSHAPLSALQLADAFLDAGLAPGAISVLPGSGIGQALVTDPGVDAISFTGSVPAGRAIARDAGLKRVVLELGGNSPNIVHADADLDLAVAALVNGGFSNTGQSCNSVQRILVHESIASELTSRLVEATSALKVGDPLDPGTDVGTLVDEDAARRVEAWVEEAVSGGATVHVGGRRDGAQYWPTILGDVRSDMKVCSDEVFGPLVSVIPYASLGEAIDVANGTAFGLQAAIFTSSLEVAFATSRALRVGGVMVNRSSNTRVDHLPFGGVDDSGLGREGGRYSLHEMTRTKLILLDPRVG